MKAYQVMKDGQIRQREVRKFTKMCVFMPLGARYHRVSGTSTWVETYEEAKRLQLKIQTLQLRMPPEDYYEEDDNGSA